jgi:hypothetical protein
MVCGNQILSPNYSSIEWSYMNNETTFICGPHLAVKKSYIIPLIQLFYQKCHYNLTLLETLKVLAMIQLWKVNMLVVSV